MSALKKILVVDDDPVIGKSIERVLSGKGYAVINAADGATALNKLANEDYDLVVTDIKMPGMSGLEVAERVRANTPWMPVLIVTGYGSDESEARAKAAGVTEFLRKPLSPEMIETSVGAAVAAPPPVVETKPAPAAAAGGRGRTHRCGRLPEEPGHVLHLAVHRARLRGAAAADRQRDAGSHGDRGASGGADLMWINARRAGAWSGKI